MKLIVGLGNPGSDYAMTRHNAGFMAVERIARRHGLTGLRHKFHAGVLEGVIAGQKVLLMQPTTFMNRSGLAVGEAVMFYKLEPADILVLVDEVALDVGTIRLRAEGTPGGHNGLADIQRVLTTKAYPRLRIGVGPQGPGPRADFVLARFTEHQFAALHPALERAADAVECWLREGIDKAMSLYNAADA